MKGCQCRESNTGRIFRRLLLRSRTLTTFRFFSRRHWSAQ